MSVFIGSMRRAARLSWPIGVAAARRRSRDHGRGWSTYRQWWHGCRARGIQDRGSAVLEFIVIGVLILVPMAYIVMSVMRVQAASMASTQAVREAARAYATADSVSQGRAAAVTDVKAVDTNVLARFLVDDPDDPESMRQRPLAEAALSLRCCIPVSRFCWNSNGC